MNRRSILPLLLAGLLACGGSPGGPSDPGRDAGADGPAAVEPTAEAGVPEPAEDTGPTDPGPGGQDAPEGEAPPEPIAEPTLEPIAEPVAEPTPEPIAEPAPEQDLDVEGEPLPEAWSDVSSEPVAEPAPEPSPEVVDAAPTEPGVEPGPEASDAPEPDMQEPPAGHPILTEFLAVNEGSLQDEDGDESDWIEVYNPTEAPLALGGWHLTDDPSDPARWTLPALLLPPGGHRLVFASGKDRAAANGELHANFKLAREGEYLALVSPQLEVVQAFAGYPPQLADVSYGPAVTITRTTLLGPGSPARAFTALTPPPADWHLPGGDDTAEGWYEGPVGLGFDASLQPDVPPSVDDLGPPLADSIADWSPVGQQGTNGWTYGYYDQGLDPDGTYAAHDFVPFPHDGAGFGPSDFWTGTAWEWAPGAPPWTAVGVSYMHPNGPDGGPLHQAVRRYRAEASGALLVHWRAAKVDPYGGGVTASLRREGVLVDTVALAGADTVGVERVLVLPAVAEGEALDWMLGPEGPDGALDGTSDGSLLAATIWRLPAVADALSTDLGDQLAGSCASLPVRLAFHVGGGPPPNRLALRVKYDDGFAAWLNGVPVAAANAPGAPAWGSLAASDRPAAATAAWTPFPLDLHAGLLAPGENLLAVLALNSAPEDPTLLLLPELEARRVTYDTGDPRYYRQPTPGADNDDGPVDLGPIVEPRTPPGAATPGQPLTVSARVQPTAAPVLGVTLVWRVMFGPEQGLPMTPQAAGVYAATLPPDAAGPGQMVRWYVLATDVEGHTTREPPFVDPEDSEQYHGTMVADPAVDSDLPVFHWFIADPAAAGTWSGARGALFHGDELYDNVRFDLHGQSTSGFPKKSYDVDFTSDHRFLLAPGLRRMKDLNLLTNWADKTKVRNTMAYELYRDAGLGYHLAFPVRLQQNGAFHSVADFVEDGDDRWLERLGLDPEGALYKMYDGLWTAAAGEKKTRKHEDHADLQALIDGLDRTGDDLRAFLYDHVNVAAMANFYVGLTLSATTDCCHKNFYAYRDTNGSGEWWTLPWDADLSFGHNWTPQKYYFEDALYPENPLFVGWSKLAQALRSQPEFEAMYLRRLRSAIDQLIQPPGTPADQLKLERRIDELVQRIGADAQLDHDAWPTWGLDEAIDQAVARVKADFLAPRRTFLFQTLAGPDGPIPPPQGEPIVFLYDGDPSPEVPAEAWIVLVNPNAFAVDLSGWRLAGAASMTLQPGTVLPAWGQLYLSPDVVAFRVRALPPTGGQGLFVQGDYLGHWEHLETLLLLNEHGVEVPQAW